MIRLIRDQVLNKSKEIFGVNLMCRSALFIKYDLFLYYKELWQRDPLSLKVFNFIIFYHSA